MTAMNIGTCKQSYNICGSFSENYNANKKLAVIKISIFLVLF